MSKKIHSSEMSNFVESISMPADKPDRDSGSILEKVHFIGENYSFVQKEIQEILTRSETHEKMVGYYRNDIEKLKSQLSKEREYTEKLLNDCQELKGSVFDLETRLEQAFNSTSEIREKEKQLLAEVEGYKKLAENARVETGDLRNKCKKIYKMLEVSRNQTGSLTSQLHDLRKEWSEVVQRLKKDKQSLSKEASDYRNKLQSANDRIGELINENQKIMSESSKIKAMFEQKHGGIQKLQFQLEDRKAMLESRDRKIKMLQDEIQGLHNAQEEHLKARTGQLYDQVGSLKTICKRLREELMAKTSEVNEIRARWQTFERVHRTEPEKVIQQLRKENEDLTQKVEIKRNSLQKLQAQEYRFQEECKKVERLEEEVSFLQDQLDEARAHTEDRSRIVNQLTLEKQQVEQQLLMEKSRFSETEMKKQQLEKNLEDLKKESRDREIDNESKRSKLQEKVNELQVELRKLEMETKYASENRSKLSQENDIFFQKVTELQKENEEIRRKIELDTEIWKSKVSSIQAEKQTLQAKQGDLQSELTRVRAQVHEHQVLLDKQKEEHEGDLLEMQNHIKELEKQIELDNSGIAELISEKETLQDRLETLQKRYEVDTDGFEQEEFNLCQKIEKLELEKSELEKSLADKDKRISELILQGKEESQRRVLEVEKLENRLDQAKAQFNLEQEASDARWSRKIEELEREHSNLLSEKQLHLENLVKSHQAEIADLIRDRQNQYESLQKERDDIRIRFKEKVQELATQKSSMEMEWDLERKSLQEALSQLQKENGELSRERQFDTEFESKLRIQHKESQRKIEELRSREAQVSNYSRLVDEQKFKLRRFADDLAEEVTGLQMLNPLSDYLELTNREISEVEVQLSKTPGLAVERKPLEEHFEKLVQQRDHLKSSLRESRQALQKKSKVIKDLCRRAVLIPLPPLPPKEEDDSSGARV